MTRDPGSSSGPSGASWPPWPVTPMVDGARQAARRLAEAGHAVYWVGGCVRDWLLGARLKDVDLATSARPDEVQYLFPGSKAVGAHFGVVMARVEGHVYEVATFRAEGAYMDRRRPSLVRYGTLEEDWRRRDFTINAMYFDPLRGELLDPAGGRADLERRVLRAVGDPAERFAEDALRLMRAVRFAARCGLAIDPATASAIRVNAAGLDDISVERVTDELARVLTGPRPGWAMRLMGDLALWPHVLPEVAAMQGCRQPANFHPEGDVFEHTARVLDHLPEAWAEVSPGAHPVPLALALSGLLHDVGKPPTFHDGPDRIRFAEHQRVGREMTFDIGRRLRLPMRLVARVAELVGQHMRFMDATRMRRSTLRQFLGQHDFVLHLALHKADCLASHGNLDNHVFCRGMLDELAAEAVHSADNGVLPPPLLNGDDLIAALGLRSGPAVGLLLKAARERQLEGELKSKEDALAWAKSRLARGGEAPLSDDGAAARDHPDKEHP